MFKYDSDIRKMNDCKIQCPPEEIYQMDGEMYRFVHLENCPNYYDNNKPVAKINPNRELGCIKKCVAIASLSCFESKENALKKYQGLSRMNKSVAKRIGCQIARFVIAKDDGYRTIANREGHFSFFESEDSNLNLKYQIVQELSTICRE